MSLSLSTKEAPDDAGHGAPSGAALFAPAVNPAPPAKSVRRRHPPSKTSSHVYIPIHRRLSYVKEAGAGAHPLDEVVPEFTAAELVESRHLLLSRVHDRKEAGEGGGGGGAGAAGGAVSRRLGMKPPDGLAGGFSAGWLADAMQNYMESEDKESQWRTLSDARFRGELLKYLEIGVRIKKHGRRGSPRSRLLRVDRQSRLTWGSSKWATLSIGSITHILSGKKTINFLRSMPRQDTHKSATLSKLEGPPRCISFLTPQRSLDLEFDDHVSADLVAYAFRRLLSL